MKQALLYGSLIIIIVVTITVTSCPCPAGTHCVNGSNLCQKCGKNKYQSQHNSNAYFCDDCDVSCGQREFVVSECTIYNNLVCQCEAGFHKEGVQESVCVPHNACKAGFEEKEPGNHMNDTLCEPCKSGTFRTADSTSKICLPCSMCGDEEDVQTKCTASQDTICRSKTDIVLIIGVCVAGVVFILVVVLVLVILRRKGYQIPFWKRSEEKRPPIDDGYHLARSMSNESPSTPTKHQRNGTSRMNSTESNDQQRVKLESVSSMGSAGGGTRSRMHSGSTSPAEISSEFQSFILKLSEDLCSIPEWKMFMRSLIGEGSDIFINSAVNDNPNNTQEQIYQVFKKWIRRNPDDASKKYVIEELKNYSLNLIALKYEEGVVTDV